MKLPCVSGTCSFAGKTGIGRTEVLVLRAPETPGTYTLYVSVRGRADKAEVVVVEPEE